MAGALPGPAQGPLGSHGAAIALAALLAIGGIARLSAVLALGDAPALQGDEEYYVSHGFALARGEGYRGSLRAPLFPAFVAAVALGFGESLRAVRLAQIPVSLLAVALVFDLVRRRFSVRAGFTSGLFCALSPTLVYYTHFLWSETLFTTALFAALWALDRWEGSRQPAWLLGAGLAFGAAAMTREMILPCAALALLWIWRTSRGVRAALLFALPIAALVLPWTARNYTLHHRFVLVSTLRWYAIAAGNQGEATPEDGDALMRRYFGNEDEIAREAEARELALRSIREQQPLWIVTKAQRNMPKLFGLGGQLERFAREGWLLGAKGTLARRLATLENALYVVLMLLGLPALWLVPGGRTKLLVAGVILYFVAVHVAANAVTRFRVPLLPLFALYVGPLLLGHVARDASRRWRLLGALGCVLAFLAALLPDFVAGLS